MCDIIKLPKNPISALSEKEVSSVGELLQYMVGCKVYTHKIYDGRELKNHDCLCCVDIERTLKDNGFMYKKIPFGYEILREREEN